jgi:hypothetical protein
LINSNFLIGKFSSNVEKSLNVYLKVNTTVSGLIDIVPKASRIDFAQLKMTPLYFDKDEVLSFPLLKSSNANYILPEKYLGSPTNAYLSMKQNEEISISPCNANNVSTICGPFLFVAAVPIFIAESTFFITNSSSGVDIILARTKTNVLGYKRTTVSQFFPKLSLSNNYTFTVYFTEEALRFSSSSLLNNSSFHCKINGSSTEYPVTVIDYKTLNCTIMNLGIDEIKVEVYLRVPLITNDSLLISKNSFVGYIARNTRII